MHLKLEFELPKKKWAFLVSFILKMKLANALKARL
jgi:hypothetical protein